MNDIVAISVCFLVACVLMLSFALYNIYRGVNDSLSNASLGSVYNFRYFQPLTGDYQRYLAKVMDIRKLDNAEISRLNWSSDYRRGDKSFKRSPTLVTCEMSNGDIRQFYAERSDMCKRSAIGSLLYRTGFARLF